MHPHDPRTTSLPFSPIILQVSGNAREFTDPVFLPHMARGSVAMGKKRGSGIPIALHLDHGNNPVLAKDCIDSGFSSVIIDGAHHPFEKNIQDELIALTKDKNTNVPGQVREKLNRSKIGQIVFAPTGLKLSDCNPCA